MRLVLAQKGGERDGHARLPAWRAVSAHRRFNEGNAERFQRHGLGGKTIHVHIDMTGAPKATDRSTARSTRTSSTSTMRIGPADERPAHHVDGGAHAAEIT